LARLPKLVSLNVGGTAVTDAGLSHLASVEGLESLSLDGCSGITDAAVGHLARISGLKRLGISMTKVTGHGLVKLREVLPKKCRVESGA
jgi:hypothetical protein